MCAKVLDIVAGSLIARLLLDAKVLIGWEEEKCMGWVSEEAHKK